MKNKYNGVALFAAMTMLTEVKLWTQGGQHKYQIMAIGIEDGSGKRFILKLRRLADGELQTAYYNEESGLCRVLKTIEWQEL
jgi:hypothetical protein